MSCVESQLVPTVTQSHTVAYRTLLVMFCVLKFYFVDFYGMFTSSPTWRLKMHVLCKVGKNNIIQNITIVRFFNSVSTCITERVFSHLEGMCSDCKQKKGSHLTSC